MSDTDRYLADLRRALPRVRRRRILAEIRSHLTEGIAAEVGRGADPDEAARLTIERLGPPDQLALQFASTGRRPRVAVFAAFGAAALVVVLVAVFSFASTRHAPGDSTVATTVARGHVEPRNRQAQLLVAQLERLHRNLVLVARHRR